MEQGLEWEVSVCKNFWGMACDVFPKCIHGQTETEQEPMIMNAIFGVELGMNCFRKTIVTGSIRIITWSTLLQVN